MPRVRRGRRRRRMRRRSEVFLFGRLTPENIILLYLL